MKREQSELLALFDYRFKELNLGRELKPGEPVYRRPMWSRADLYHIEEAAKLHANANLSDPFAGDRMRCHLLRGLDTASDVKRAALSAINARRVPV